MSKTDDAAASPKGELRTRRKDETIYPHLVRIGVAAGEWADESWRDARGVELGHRVMAVHDRYKAWLEHDGRGYRSALLRALAMIERRARGAAAATVVTATEEAIDAVQRFDRRPLRRA